MVIDPNTGVIYVFGGIGYSFSLAATNGYLNDLWRWTPSNSWWTWINGTNFFNVAGKYGTMGVAAASNCPGGRWWPALVMEPQTQRLYLFGGYGYDSVGK